MWLDKNMSIE
jgi:hypothetical protein